MSKKQYVAPELEFLILEQSDIITTSGDASGAEPGTGGGGDGGIFDGWED